MLCLWYRPTAVDQLCTVVWKHNKLVLLLHRICTAKGVCVNLALTLLYHCCQHWHFCLCLCPSHHVAELMRCIRPHKWQRHYWIRHSFMYCAKLLTHSPLSAKWMHVSVNAWVKSESCRLYIVWCYSHLASQMTEKKKLKSDLTIKTLGISKSLILIRFQTTWMWCGSDL